MSNILVVKSTGRFIVWVWLKDIKRRNIKYQDVNLAYSDWLFLGVGCLFFGIIVGITLLYFYYH